MLETLNLNVNCLTEFPDLQNCRKITKLYLNSNQIGFNSLLSRFAHLNFLEVLDLGSNMIELGEGSDAESKFNHLKNELLRHETITNLRIDDNDFFEKGQIQGSLMMSADLYDTMKKQLEIWNGRDIMNDKL